jgi:hypothetical protein
MKDGALRPKPYDSELGVRYVNQGNEHLVLKQNSSWTEQRFYPSNLGDVFALMADVSR